MVLAMAGCAASRSERVERALLSDEPPADFWLAVTVLRPVPLGALINARTEAERSTVPRAARYVVEADAVLRVAVGYGATEDTYPARTRQLTRGQMWELWRALRGTGLVDADHPDRTGRLPELDEFGKRTAGRGGYCVSFSIEGERRALAIDEARPAAAEARMLVERLAALAWIERPREEPPVKSEDGAAQGGAEPEDSPR